MKTAENYDVAVVGAGMVGATLALALAQAGIRVALIESRHPDTTLHEPFDLRVSAITQASQHIFEALNVWPKMQARRVSPFREMHVWDATGDGQIQFDSADLGQTELGHIIENSVVTAALHEQIAQQEYISLLCPFICKSFQIDAEAISITAEDQTVIQARLLVGADGSRSWVRQQAGISVRGWDYDQAAVVTYVKTTHSHHETAWQRFMPDGPLAFLPLLDGYSSIVWSTTPAHARYLSDLDEEKFCLALADAFEHKLGEVTTCGPRANFPLRFMLTQHYIQSRLALVGDAAHTMHPLAGQGVNLGLEDAAALAEVLIEAHKQRQDVGQMKVLRRYERWRRADNLPMLSVVDGFKRLFGSDVPAVRWLRNTGMSIVDLISPLKHNLITQAMGSKGSRPKLSRGMIP